MKRTTEYKAVSHPIFGAGAVLDNYKAACGGVSVVFFAKDESVRPILESYLALLPDPPSIQVATLRKATLNYRRNHPRKEKDTEAEIAEAEGPGEEELVEGPPVEPDEIEQDHSENEQVEPGPEEFEQSENSANAE